MPNRRTLYLALAAPLAVTLIAVAARLVLPESHANRFGALALSLAAASWVVTGLSMAAASLLARAAERDNAPSQLLATGLTRFIHGGMLVSMVLHALAVLSSLIVLSFLAYANAGQSSGALQAITALAVLLMTLFVILLARLARTLLHANQPRIVTTLGKRMTSRQGRMLWRRVRALARRVDAPEPNHIVVGLDAGCFVTELDVRCLDTTLRGRTLYLSLPYMRVATVEEMEALIAHELAHLKSSNTRLGRACGRLFGSAANTAATAESATGQLQLAVLAGPSAAILQHVRNVLQTAVSRKLHNGELRADQAAAAIAKPAILALALMRAQMCVVWDDVAHIAYRQAMPAGHEPADNYSALFEDIARNADVGFDMGQLIAAQHPHPTDIHPALGPRLRALGINTDDAFACALDIPAPVDCALPLIDDSEPVELELTLAAHALRTGRGTHAARINDDELPDREDMPEDLLVFASRRKTILWVAAGAALAAVLVAGALILAHSGLRAVLAGEISTWAIIGGAALIALLGGLAMALGQFAAFYAELAFGRRPVFRLCAYGIQAFNEIADGDILAWSELGDVIMMRKDRKGVSQTLAFVAGDPPTVLRRIHPWRRLLAQVLPGVFPVPHFVTAGVLPMSLESAYTLVARYHDHYVRR
jgi:Zn-dependent protease with chaperone function